MIRAPFKNRHTKQHGFTIIEVLIVLAIAGVIMLVVFLAVPALQRSSRNTQRRSDVSHMASLFDEYASNHSGAMPTSVGSSGCVLNTSDSFSIMPAMSTTCVSVTASVGTTTYTADLDTWHIYSNAVCNNNAITFNTGGTRSVVIAYGAEPGPTTQCVQA